MKVKVLDVKFNVFIYDGKKFVVNEDYTTFEEARARAIELKLKGIRIIFLCNDSIQEMPVEIEV